MRTEFERLYQRVCWSFGSTQNSIGWPTTVNLGVSEEQKRTAKNPKVAILAVRPNAVCLDLGFGFVGAEALFGQLDLFVDVVAEFGESGRGPGFELVAFVGQVDFDVLLDDRG